MTPNDNPYLNPPATGTMAENSDEQCVVVQDVDGTQHIIAMAREIVVLDPTTGERAFKKVQYLVRTHDGRLILNPTKEQLYACPTCNRKILTQHAVRFCQACQDIECMHCIKIVPDANGQPQYLCQSCYGKTRLKRIIQWLFHLDR
jgi:hypothetical protein